MESNAIPTGTRWRKSSYSSDQGGDCIECAPLGPLAWHKSSHSGDQGGQCVEITETPCPIIAIRDSKNPRGPQLAVVPAAFDTFVGWAASAHAA